MKSESESDAGTDRVVSSCYVNVTYEVPNSWQADCPLRVHPANYHKGNHKLKDSPPNTGTNHYLRGRVVTLDQGEVRTFHRQQQYTSY